MRRHESERRNQGHRHRQDAYSASLAVNTLARMGWLRGRHLVADVRGAWTVVGVRRSGIPLRGRERPRSRGRVDPGGRAGGHHRPTDRRAGVVGRCGRGRDDPSVATWGTRALPDGADPLRVGCKGRAAPGDTGPPRANSRGVRAYLPRRCPLRLAASELLRGRLAVAGDQPVRLYSWWLLVGRGRRGLRAKDTWCLRLLRTERCWRWVDHAFRSGTVGEVWPLWGVALGAATLAYYYRRRGRCSHCGRV